MCETLYWQRYLLQEISPVSSELEKLIELQKTDTNIRKLKKAIEYTAVKK